MTWFFAFLIVALMGVIAVVASGRGGWMADAYDDRPDSRVQADGPLTATDLRQVRFSTSFRGYRMSEVDALLDRLAEELSPPVQEVLEEPLAEAPADDAGQGEPPSETRAESRAGSLPESQTETQTETQAGTQAEDSRS